MNKLLTVLLTVLIATSVFAKGNVTNNEAFENALRDCTKAAETFEKCTQLVPSYITYGRETQCKTYGVLLRDALISKGTSIDAANDISNACVFICTYPGIYELQKEKLIQDCIKDRMLNK